MRAEISATALFLLCPPLRPCSFLFLTSQNLHQPGFCLHYNSCQSCSDFPVVNCTTIIIMVLLLSSFSPLPPHFPPLHSERLSVSPSVSQLVQHYSLPLFCVLAAGLFILSSVTFLIFYKSLLTLTSSLQSLCFVVALGKDSSAFLLLALLFPSSSWNPLQPSLCHQYSRKTALVKVAVTSMAPNPVVNTLSSSCLAGQQYWTLLQIPFSFMWVRRCAGPWCPALVPACLAASTPMLNIWELRFAFRLLFSACFCISALGHCVSSADYFLFFNLKLTFPSEQCRPVYRPAHSAFHHHSVYFKLSRARPSSGPLLL